jgi:hypothetical protein
MLLQSGGLLCLLHSISCVHVCIGRVCVLPWPPPVTDNQIHVFGSVNEHPLHTSKGEAIVGPNTFGYNIVVPRYPPVSQPRNRGADGSDDAYLHDGAGATTTTSETPAPLLGGRLPIRSIRYIGTNSDGVPTFLLLCRLVALLLSLPLVIFFFWLL